MKTFIAVLLALIVFNYFSVVYDYIFPPTYKWSMNWIILD